jgi:hypothetical protein
LTDEEELLKRYVALYASNEAGNTGVNSEILSIINTLRNRGCLHSEVIELMVSHAEAE